MTEGASRLRAAHHRSMTLSPGPTLGSSAVLCALFGVRDLVPNPPPVHPVAWGRARVVDPYAISGFSASSASLNTLLCVIRQPDHEDWRDAVHRSAREGARRLTLDRTGGCGMSPS
jgi:hypothetical protein